MPVSAGQVLPYRDYGGNGPHIVALHGHFGSSASFGALAAALDEKTARLTAPDQRGHGFAPRGSDASVESYLALLEAFVEHHISAPVTLFGHSMGGTHAMLLAERRPDLVGALVVEDQPMVVGSTVLDVTAWPRRWPSFLALAEDLRGRGIDDPSYFIRDALRFADGWGLGFDHDDMVESQRRLVGDYSRSWQAIQVPTLLIRGAESFILDGDMAAEMITMQPKAVLREFDGCGHWVHDDDPAGVAGAVREFIANAIR
ncbi:alpha/beta hydrolase [Nocardioidaceae bacterium SCSIO 66511]|nr:alpha/beta hydrolase [Nocardioidaceae bacterium SCSIO 66511]